MKRKLVFVQAALVIGLMVFAGSAFATPLHYYDAQITDIPAGKTTIAANTTFADGTAFTASPYDPDTNPAGNWTNQSNANFPGNGADGFWKRRPYHNPDGNVDYTNGPTIYESRGQYNGPNTEDLPILKTTVAVPEADQGELHSVWVLFWSDSSPWRISASLWNQWPSTKYPVPVDGKSEFPQFDPYYVQAGYKYRAYNATEGPPGDPYEVEIDATDTNSGGRKMWAGYLGDVVLDPTLTVYVDDGFVHSPTSGDGAHNFRTWYDGIAYGDPLYDGEDPRPALADKIIPEPASVMLLCIGLAGVGLLRRRG